jgi:hypothetical protein
VSAGTPELGGDRAMSADGGQRVGPPRHELGGQQYMRDSAALAAHPPRPHRPARAAALPNPAGPGGSPRRNQPPQPQHSRSAGTASLNTTITTGCSSHAEILACCHGPGQGRVRVAA